MEFFSKIVAERCRLFLQKNSIRDAGGGGGGGGGNPGPGRGQSPRLGFASLGTPKLCLLFIV